jgi:EAL domain-containing protein (putative c-di-GMP-specific phosphodiesterase class I)
VKSDRPQAAPRSARSNRLSDAPQASEAPESGSEPASLMALRGMVSPDDVSVVFQPIVELCGGRLFAHEALVRCRVPELRSPIALFENALAVGCVGRLGRMIREVAVPLSEGQPLFLNVHPQELREGWLVRPDDPIFVHDHDVFLEVTESVPLLHFELCLNVLRELRVRGGVHLVVDDLGAGYSNLKRIADLEPRVVKLDRELIAGIEQSIRQQQLVRSVVRLCGDLDALVVAEGIETKDELSALADTGAQLGQGFLFARPAFPMPPISFP